MDKTTTFETHRPLLFSIAYRMLGGVMEAEDMVQEVFVTVYRRLGELRRHITAGPPDEVHLVLSAAGRSKVRTV